MSKRTSIFAIILASFFAVSTAQAVESLHFQSCYNAAQNQNIEILEPWTASIKDLTKGEIEVEFFASGDLVAMSSSPQAIKDGMLDVGVWGGSIAPKKTPHLLSISSLPFITKSSQHGTALLWAAYEQLPEIKAEADSTGKLFALWTTASFSISSINTPIRKPADLKGKRVMIITAADSGIVEAWGGVPVYVSPSDVYIGLQRGLAEAFFTAIPYQKGLKVYEIAKYITVLPCSSTSMVMTMNQDLFDSLSSEQQKVFIDSTGKDFSIKIAKHLDNDVEIALGEFKKAGAEVINLEANEIEAFNAALDGFIDGYWVNYLKDAGIKDSSAWIKKIKALSDSIPNPNA